MDKRAHPSYARGKRRAAGVCVECGNPLAPTSQIMCEFHLAKSNKRNKENWARYKDAAFKAYGGYVCKCCGETEPRFLSIDHVNGGGNEHRKQIGKGYGIFLWLKRNGYPNGFRILCHNCNLGRQANGGICPHESIKAATNC